MIFLCVYCQNEFVRANKEVNRGRTKYCSPVCFQEHAKKRALVRAEQILKAGKKQCKACNSTIPLHKFPKSKNSTTGYFSYCIECRREMNKAADAKRWSEKREILIRQRRNANYRKTFGITLEDYERLLEKQNGKCAICHSEYLNKYHAVDHNHKTGQIRGILCENCNRGLGMFKDNIGLMHRAIGYLEESSQ